MVRIHCDESSWRSRPVAPVGLEELIYSEPLVPSHNLAKPSYKLECRRLISRLSPNLLWFCLCRPSSSLGTKRAFWGLLGPSGNGRGKVSI
jgi:hypothetical protein